MSVKSRRGIKREYSNHASSEEIARMFLLRLNFADEKKPPHCSCTVQPSHSGKYSFFQSLIDNAQLTMRKADMSIARLYADLVTDTKIRERIFAILLAEFQRTEAAILAVTGQKRLLASDPVLLRSIELRNPYIDPLNYLQIEMLRRLRRGDLAKDREEAVRSVVELTINGISGGLKLSLIHI